MYTHPFVNLVNTPVMTPFGMLSVKLADKHVWEHVD